VSENVIEVASRPVLSVSSETSVKDAAEYMVSHNVRRLLVTEEGRAIGVFSAFHLIRMLATGTDPSSRPLSRAGLDVPVYVGPTTPVIEAAKVMASRDVTAVLVGPEGSPQGILTTHDVVSYLPYGAAGSASLHEALVPDYPVLDPGATLLEAASVISSRGTSGVLIVDGESFLGIVTVRDVLQAYASAGGQAMSARVEDLPMSPAAYIDEGATVGEAAEVMESIGSDVAVVFCGPRPCGGIDDISLTRWLASRAKA
jgi:CBS domain-containing protein